MTIVVFSRDEDFSAALAEQVTRELALPVALARDEKEARALEPGAAAIVCGEPLGGKWKAPLVRLTPPIRLSEALAGIRRAAAAPAAGDMKLGRHYRFSPQQKTVTHLPSGNEANLTDKEAQLLYVLAQAKGVADKDRLLKEVWSVETELESHTLETHVYRLRAKLRDLGMKEPIVAVEGGYRLEIT